ncbi:MAG: hypothetical protein MZV63_11270 [Marinilabiliales bacterium]|nr:hypothetical protein [Marinilabiliales bacterium]
MSFRAGMTNLMRSAQMCRWLAGNGFSDTPLHFSRFHPQYKLEHLPPTPAGILTKAVEIALGEGLRNMSTSGTCPEQELMIPPVRHAGKRLWTGAVSG